ncbi:MAG TPA: pyridoxal-phosphate dependent enzyme, partial [Polyangiaceae bacterium]
SLQPRARRIMTKRIILAHLPTPIHHFDALDRLVGVEVWLKRDDFTAGAAAGNKVRKLEFLLAEATQRAATHVITCGGEQSNHARATALFAAQLGMRSVLLLRTNQPSRPPRPTGNILLSRLSGAKTLWITPEDYAQRDRLMAEEAGRLSLEGAWPYVIPEGGSNGLGALGYVQAMLETRQQLDLGLLGAIREFDSIVTACGSGGTAAGAGLGAHHYGVAGRVQAIAVCDDIQYFRNVIDGIVLDARAIDPKLSAAVPIDVVDEYRGPAYAVASEEQLAFIADVARATGVILDPVYTGKALYALSRMRDKPQRCLFLHTGGLPGALAQPEALAAFATYERP